MPAYREWLPLIAPPPLRAVRGAKWFAEVGAQCDRIADRARLATLLRVPGKEYRDGAVIEAPTDALDRIGADRQLPRGVAETNPNYASRLRQAWSIWGGDNTPLLGKGGGAGSHRSLLLALKAAGFPTGGSGATIVQYNGRYAQLDGSDNLVLGNLQNCQNRPDLTGSLTARPGWNLDATDKHWASFAIVFPADVPALLDTAGNATKAALNVTVRKWRPAKAWYRGAFVIAAGGAWGWPVAGNTWGDGSNWGSDTVRFISPDT